MKTLQQYIYESQAEEQIDESWKNILLSAVLGFASLTAHAQTTSVNDVNPKVETVAKEQNKINLVKVKVSGDSKEDCIKKAQQKITDFCKENDEKVLTINLKGYEPRVTSLSKSDLKTNNMKIEGDYEVTYECGLLLSQSYGNNGVINL